MLNEEGYSYLEVVFPEVKAYSSVKELSAQLVEGADGDYIALKLPDPHLTKRIIVFPENRHSLSVEVFVCEGEMMTDGCVELCKKHWHWQRIGRSRRHGQGVPVILDMVDQAWRMLKSFGSPDLERKFTAMVAHVEGAIHPILGKFSDRCSAGITSPTWDERIIAWPLTRPKLRIKLKCSPRLGIQVQPEMLQRGGILLRESWSKYHWGFRIADWDDLQQLQRMIDLAKERLDNPGESEHEKLHSLSLYMAYPHAYEFASQRGIKPKIKVEGAEYICLEWNGSMVRKKLQIQEGANSDLQLWLTATPAHQLAADVELLHREAVGVVKHAAGLEIETLVFLLDRAWEKVNKFNLECLEEEHQTLVAFIMSRIDPYLAGFAASRGGQFARLDSNRREILWPKDALRYGLRISIDPVSGITFTGQHETNLGHSVKKLDACEKVQDLKLKDLSNYDRLPELLDEARRRLESCTGLGLR